MKKINSFFTENLFISVAGHLVLVAAMIASIAVVAKRIQTIAPDRVQITEIDLSTISVTMDKTQLHNVTVPMPDKPTDKANDVPEPETKPVKIEKPTLVDKLDGDDEPKPKKPADAPKPTPEPTPVPAPREKTTVRVNRDTLTRTMTISAIDAFRTAMTRCWVIEQTRPELADLRVVVHMTMYENGMVRDMWVEEASRAQTDAGFAYAVETIKTAISICQPFSMLPKNEFDGWKEIQLTFYPASVMVQ